MTNPLYSERRPSSTLEPVYPYTAPKWVVGLDLFTAGLLDIVLRRPAYRCARAADIGIVLFVVGVAAYASLMTAMFGMPPTTRFPPDDFLWLEGAWHLYLGQASSNDFFNPVGFLYYWLLYEMMTIIGPKATTIAWTQYTISFVLTFLTWVVVRNRLPVVAGVVFTIIVAVYLFSHKSFGDTIFVIGANAFYNKIGSVILSVIFIQSLCYNNCRVHYRWYDAVCCGLLMAMMFSIKISFFLIAAPIVLLGMVLVFRQDKKVSFFSSTVIVISFTFFVILFTGMTGTHFAAYIRDIATAGEARDLAHLILFRIPATVSDMGFLFFLIITVALYVFVTPGRFGENFQRVSLVCLLGLASIIGVKLTCGQDLDPLLSGTIAVSFLGAMDRRKALVVRLNGMKRTDAAMLRGLFMSLLAAPLLVITVQSIIGEVYARYLTIDAASHPGRYLTISTPSMAGWRFAPQALDARPGHADYVRTLQAGIKIVEAVAKPHEIVAVLDHMNPFPFFLRMPVQRGGSLFWFIGNSLRVDQVVEYERIIGNAHVVLYPYDPNVTEVRNILFRNVEDILTSDYHVVEDTEHWKVYRRNAE